MGNEAQTTNAKKKVIYDFGSNNGDDIPYYLLKSDLVVAVEANPLLCDQIRTRFGKAIAEGRLIVKNCILSAGDSAAGVPFYIHKSNHVESQFPRPAPSAIGQYEEVYLPSKNVIEVLKCHGDPYYIKIDLEHYDQAILKELFLHDIRPPYLSAESHSIEVFCLFVALGNYESFKLVDGKTVSKKYKEHRIATNTGPQIYSFPHHSAGPFGNDIKGDWITPDNFSRLLLYAELGWKDIHASNVDNPNHSYAPSPQYQIGIKIEF